MTISRDTKVNTALKLPFTHPDLLEGETVFSTMILKDGVIYTGLATPPVYTENGNGLYCIEINFNATGYFTVFIEGQIVAYINVVTKDLYSTLTDLDDVAQGSWNFDKKTGVLTLYRQGGAVLRTYNFTDDNNVTSRELVG